MICFRNMTSIDDYSGNIAEVGQTKINTTTWTVPGFIKLLERKAVGELRPEKSKYATIDLIDTGFQIKMKFLGRDNDIVAIYYSSPTSVFLKSVLLTLGLKQCEERSIVTKENDTVEANKWQILATLLKRDIYEGPEKFLWTDQSTLRLKFQFVVTNDIKVHRSHIPQVQLSNDFENLLNDCLFSDVIMKSAECMEYKAHKAVLASRSAVLKAHFKHDTTECYTNIVESPLESEVLREVLKFIYSDKAPGVNKMPEKLFAAADYYQLSRLMVICAEALHKNLTVENAIKTLQLADLHSAKTLKLLTLEFIKEQGKQTSQAKLIINKTDGGLGKSEVCGTNQEDVYK